MSIDAKLDTGKGNYKVVMWEISKYSAKYGIYLAFFLLIVVLSILSPNFLTVANLTNIVKQVSINGILAIGATYVLLSGGIDLSPGSLVALTGVVAASFSHPGEYPVFVPILAGLAVGALFGAINGFVIAKGKIPPFIVTLGMWTAARGVALVYTDGRPVIDVSDSYRFIGGGYIFGVPILIYFLVIVFVIAYFVLNNTVFGRRVYAIGGNETAAQVSGINVNAVKIAVYSIAGLLAGLGGILLSSRILSGSPVAGTGYELDAIAAAVIGGTSTSGGVGKLYGTMVGALIIGVMNNGLDLLNVSSYYQQIVKGVIIVLAVYIDARSKQKS